MKILIAIPTYNRVGALAKAVAMFRAQTPAHELHLLIVNDGDHNLTSSDPSITVVNLSQRLALCDKRYAYFEYAKTHDFDLLMGWDDDDVYYPSYADEMARAILKTGTPFGCLHYRHWMMSMQDGTRSRLEGYPFNCYHGMTCVNLRICGENHLFKQSNYQYPLPSGSLAYRDDQHKDISYRYSLSNEGVGIIYIFNF